MATPINPAIKKRMDSVVKGGATATIIRAELNAEDHISANVTPNKMARKSMTDPYTISVMIGDTSSMK